MSDERDARREAMKAEVEAMLQRQKEDFERLKAMDPSDKEAILRETDALIERIEQEKRIIERFAWESAEDAMEFIDKKRAENPAFAEWFEGFSAEQEKLFREKNEKEGWHEIIE